MQQMMDTGRPGYGEPRYSENLAVTKGFAGLFLYTGKVPWLIVKVAVACWSFLYLALGR